MNEHTLLMDIVNDRMSETMIYIVNEWRGTFFFEERLEKEGFYA